MRFDGLLLDLTGLNPVIKAIDGFAPVRFESETGSVRNLKPNRNYIEPYGSGSVIVQIAKPNHQVRLDAPNRTEPIQPRFGSVRFDLNQFG